MAAWCAAPFKLALGADRTDEALVAARLIYFQHAFRLVGFEQTRSFEQPAEVFLAGDLFSAGFAGQARQGFVFHFQPL